MYAAVEGIWFIDCCRRTKRKYRDFFSFKKYNYILILVFFIIFGMCVICSCSWRTERRRRIQEQQQMAAATSCAAPPSTTNTSASTDTSSISVIRENILAPLSFDDLDVLWNNSVYSFIRGDRHSDSKSIQYEHLSTIILCLHTIRLMLFYLCMRIDLLQNTIKRITDR